MKREEEEHTEKEDKEKEMRGGWIWECFSHIDLFRFV